MSNIFTVFADGSFVDQDGIKAGGYAYWCRGDGDEVVKGAAEWQGAHIDEIETVGLAVAAMEAIDRLPPLAPGGCIVLQSDSTRALGTFMMQGCGIPAKTSDRPITRWRGNKTAETFVIEAMKAMAPITNRIYLKHVKAHSQVGDPRSWVNEWCDEAAKRMRREQHLRLRKAHEASRKMKEVGV